MSTWTLRERTAAGGVGKILQDWTGVLTENLNTPDTLQVVGRTAHLRPLLTPGCGCTLETDAGGFSGYLSLPVRRGDGTCTLTFRSYLGRLWSRGLYPDPANAWTAQATAYDTRTGVAETVALGFISANLGSGAMTGRPLAGLTIPATLGRGATVTVTGRFDNVGRLVADILETSGLRVQIVTSGAGYLVTMNASPDLSASATYGDAYGGGPGLISQDWEISEPCPEVTTALVAGSGDLTSRVARERTDAAAEALWGFRFESFVDQSATGTTAELDKAGDDALAAGSAPVAVKATIPDLPNLRLGSDVPVGATVGLTLDGTFLTARLRQVTTTIGPDGVTRTGVVGDPSAGLTYTQKQFMALHKSIRRVLSR